MKKLLVTSADFEGEVVLLYGEEGVGAEAYPPLLSVDFRGARLSDHRKAYICRHVPVRLGVIKNPDGTIQTWNDQWSTDKLKFTPADIEMDFENDFWKPFNNKHNKERTIKEWKKLKSEELILACNSVTGYNWHLAQPQYSWKSKMAADRYLREKQWTTDWYHV